MMVKSGSTATADEATLTKSAGGVFSAKVNPILLAGTPATGTIGTGSAAPYYLGGGGRSVGSATESLVKAKCPFAFQVTSFSISLSANAAASPIPFALRVNGATVASTTIAAGATGSFVIACSVAVAADSFVNLMLDVQTGGGACTVEGWNVRGY